jgi:hypothetical protein
MLAVNLRGDLAKLSDAELAERLDAAWREHDAAGTLSSWSVFRPDRWLWSRRGPVRHPRAYRFILSMGGMNSGHWIEWLFPVLASTKTFGSLIPKRSATNVHLTLCEIRDVMDEMERRLKSRKGNVQ